MIIAVKYGPLFQLHFGFKKCKTYEMFLFFLSFFLYLFYIYLKTKTRSLSTIFDILKRKVSGNFV